MLDEACRSRASTSCSARAPSCSSRATTTPPPSRSAARATSRRTRTRSARPTVGRCSAPDGCARRPRSSRPLWSTRRPTTTRCSASAAPCSAWAATPRRATRWRWPPTSSRSARTTASTSARRAAARPSGGPINHPNMGSRARRADHAACALWCYPRSTTSVPADVRRRCSGSGREPALSFERGGWMSSIQHEIETRLAEREPEVEVLLAELRGDTVELYIDHPDGVTLELCERVTHALPELREDHGLTVSSPGIERPLSKPDHFRRFIGRRARVRTRDLHDGRKSFTGELVGASETEVTIAADGGVVAIPYDAISRSNLVES